MAAGRIPAQSSSSTARSREQCPKMGSAQAPRPCTRTPISRCSASACVEHVCTSTAVGHVSSTVGPQLRKFQEERRQLRFAVTRIAERLTGEELQKLAAAVPAGSIRNGKMKTTEVAEALGASDVYIRFP